MLKAAFYRGTRPGYLGLVDKFGRRLDHGPYSHTELVFSNGISGSSSKRDGGVRLKYIGYSSDHWDFVTLPDKYHDTAYQWFIDHRDCKYDDKGVLNAFLGLVTEDPTRFFCSEACAAALRLEEAWRYKPNGLYAVLKELN